MSDDTTGLGIEPGTTPVEVAAGGSLLDRLKAERDALDDLLTIDIPSWSGALKARYEVVSRRDLEKMVRRINSTAKGKADTNAGIEADVEFLSKACVGIVAYDEETGEEEIVGKGFDSAFASALGNPDGTDSQLGLVLYLFKGNGIALTAHAMKVARWMQDTSKPVEDPQ